MEKKDKFIITSCIIIMFLIAIDIVVTILCHSEISAKDIFEKNIDWYSRP